MSALLKTGSARHAIKDRGVDLYETPPCATQALLRHKYLLTNPWAGSSPRPIWEPACGRGAIVEVLRHAGHEVTATDLHDHGWAGAQCGRDFFKEAVAPVGVDTIITNPPYFCADEFIRHGLTLCSEVIVLMRLAYLEGAKRKDLIDRHLSEVLVGIERLPMMHRDGWAGPKIGSGAMPFAWFVFVQQRQRDFTKLKRISWRESEA